MKQSKKVKRPDFLELGKCREDMFPKILEEVGGVEEEGEQAGKEASEGETMLVKDIFEL